MIWYQGENNVSQAQRYQTLLPMLINDWRIGFRQGNVPFITVQLASYMKRYTYHTESTWAELRKVQTMSLAYPNTGLAVTLDIGEADNIHPRNKRDVGKRLFLEAQKIAYRTNDITMGPRYKSMHIEGNTIIIHFYNSQHGLKVKGDSLSGFAIAGKDGKYVFAKAIIDGGKVIFLPKVF